MNEKYLWDGDKLRELYVEKEMGINKIAEIADCSNHTVELWLDNHDIETRDVGGREKNHVTYTTTAGGYRQWVNQVPGERTTKTISVHRLLLTLKHDPEEFDGMHVHHRNGIPWDNRLENLELLTPKEHRQRHTED